VAFLLFAVVAAVTPGPSNVMLTAAGARAGVLKGLPCLLGVTTGMALMMFVVPLGLGTLVLTRPLLLTTLKWVGAAFLLWLSWDIATAPTTADTPAPDPVGYLEAATFQWINPKSWLVTMSAAATFLGTPTERALIHAAWLAALFFLASLPACLLWLTFGATLHRIVTTGRRRRLVNATLGLLLAASVILVVR
jgi:threonine/homoserine/homoserine lactone efflux protein